MRPNTQFSSSITQSFCGWDSLLKPLWGNSARDAPPNSLIRANEMCVSASRSIGATTTWTGVSSPLCAVRPRLWSCIILSETLRKFYLMGQGIAEQPSYGLQICSKAPDIINLILT